MRVVSFYSVTDQERLNKSLREAMFFGSPKDVESVLKNKYFKESTIKKSLKKLKAWNKKIDQSVQQQKQDDDIFSFLKKLKRDVNKKIKYLECFNS